MRRRFGLRGFVALLAGLLVLAPVGISARLACGADPVPHVAPRLGDPPAGRRAAGKRPARPARPDRQGVGRRAPRCPATPQRGRTAFRRECSKCHKLEDYGVELGLPLDTIQNRGPETILLSVLDPNRDVLPQYLNYVVVTDDGLSATGMIESETATSITLKRAEGESDTVLRTNIDELVNTGMSIMPEGNEKLVTKQEMADIIAYLMSLE